MGDNDRSSDEISSYSEEDVTMEVDDELEPQEGDENDLAIEAILDESERLEENVSTVKRNGKHKAPKASLKAQEGEMWKILAKLQEEIKSLKRPRSTTESRNSLQSSDGKRQKIQVETNAGAYDRPSVSSKGESMEVEPQLSSVLNDKQLSSAKSAQLKPATKQQLSSAQDSEQLSSAQKPRTTDDAITIRLDDNDDPLQEELQQQNDDDDSSSEDDAEEGIFEDMVGAIDIQGEDETPGPPLTQIWADKINLAWKTKVNKTAMTALLQKYKTPSNLDALKVPQMNNSIWKLCNKWQRKADLNMSACQRNLIKVVTAVLKIHDHLAVLPRSTRQLAMQTTADIVSMLGKVNREMASKRKISARPVLLGDYKSLATTTEASGENLFGDNLTQVWKVKSTLKKELVTFSLN